MKLSIREIALSMLEGGNYTRKEIEELSGCSHSGLHKAMHKMHAEKLIHICKWDRPDGRGNFEATYRLGNRPDAKKPTPYTHQEIARRHYQRNKKRINARRSALKAGRPINPFAQLLWSSS